MKSFQKCVETVVYSMKFFQKCEETLVYSMKFFQKYVETVVYSVFSFQKYEETLVYSMFSKLLGLETVVFSYFSKFLAVAPRLYSLLREFLAVATRSAVSPAEAASLYGSTSCSYPLLLTENACGSAGGLRRRVGVKLSLPFFLVVPGAVVLASPGTALVAAILVVLQIVLRVEAA